MPISPSGSTLATILNSGVDGVLAAVLVANPSVSAGTRKLVASYGRDLDSGIHELSDTYFGGEPVSQADIAARLDDLASGLAVLGQVVTEVKQLVASNPGTFRTTVSNFAGTGTTRRTFP